VLLYLWTARHHPPAEDGSFRLGRWERPVVAGALAWLGVELVVLLAPARFRPAQAYALGALGAVVYALLRLAEPAAMTSQPQPSPPDPDTRPAGEQPLW